MSIHRSRIIRRFSLVAAFFCSLFFAVPLFSAPDSPRVFTVAFYPETIEWNPLASYSASEAQLYTAVYEGLVTYNPSTLRPVPGVATRWDLSQDKKTYTFHLRSDARFWDGSIVTAAVFRDSWLKILDPAVKSPFSGLLDPIKGAAEFRSGANKDPKNVGISVIDDQTLSVELSQPSAYFVQVLCHQALVPIHPALLQQKVWDEKTEIIGNGPFRFSKRTTDLVELVPAETYWDKSAVQLDKIELIFKDDAEGITERFNDGAIDWIESGADYRELTDPYSFQMTPQFSTTFMYFSGDQAAYRNPLVRKGLALMLPFDEIRSKEYFLVPSAQLVPSIPYYPAVASLEKQDAGQGLKLLEQAGYTNGKGLPPITLHFPKSDTWHRTALLMQQAWKNLDVKVIIDESDAEDYFDTLKASQFTIATISWVGDYADPMTFLDLWSSTSSLNTSKFSSTDFDKLLKDSNTEQGSARLKTLSKAEEYLLLNAQVLPINHSPAFNVIDLSRVDGWFENPLNIHPFKYFQFKALKPPRSIALGL